jgi:tetratricopeptide (TPR) repeat protein
MKKDGTGSIKAVKPGSTAPVQKPSEPVDLLAEAVRRIDEKQYAGAEAILNQMLTREPGNPQVCQLLARLHLQRGDVQVALGEYRFLAGAALRAHDLILAESLIQEFLAADPNSVPLLELNGELHEEKGDGGEAARQYAKAIELLMEHPEPGMESLHEELFEKVRSLSSDEALVSRLAARMRGGSTVDQSESAQNLSEAEAPPHLVDPILTDGESVGADSNSTQAVHSNGRMTDDQKFSPVGTEPETSQLRVEPVKTQSVGKVSASQTHDLPKTEGPAPPPVAHLTEFVAYQASTESVTPGKPAVAPPANVKESAAPPDYEAHYTLGVAYKNMGLYEEAKEEFQISTDSDSFYLDSALMTAVCLKEERHIAQAIHGLETVLTDPRCQGAKAQAIRYELGLLYEAEEQWEKAADAFQSIPSFHDVPQRLAALKGRQVSGEVGFRYAS